MGDLAKSAHRHRREDHRPGKESAHVELFSRALPNPDFRLFPTQPLQCMLTRESCNRMEARMRFMRLHLASLVALWFCALSAAAFAQPADLVLRGGKVITVDKDWRIAQAVAVKDGRFLAVGDDAAIAAHIGPQTQVIE